MRRHSSGKLSYYTFDSLDQIQHAISTRHGGVSPAPFNTLNLSINSGDTTSNVDANTKRLHDTLALDVSATVTASQAQADQVAIVNLKQRGTRVQNVDALITDQPNLPLLLRYADCVPILLHDPAHRAIGIVHAGWRGTVAKIAAKSVKAMQETFGSRARDIIACIGPSIGPCCYEIGEEVTAKVRAALENADTLLTRHNCSVHFNLWQANAMQMRNLGIEQIEIAEICTADHSDDFYSWRAENKNTGRFGALIAIRE